VTATPTRPEELAVLEALLEGERPRYAAERLGVPPRRLARWIEKWERRFGYDWGCAADLGWLYDDRAADVREFIERARGER